MNNIKHSFKRFLSHLSFPHKLDGRVVILTYHSVSPHHQFSVKPEDFEAQIKYLSEKFNIISLDQISCYSLFNHKPPVIVTFDDGYEDNYTFAYPILKKYNCTATVFITSDFIFNNLNITKGWGFYEGLRPLKVNQIKEMLESGISFGSHGKTHERLSGLNLTRLREETIISKKEIDNNFNCNISLFSYPFGQKNDFNNDCVNYLKSAGYTIACSNMWGFNKNSQLDLFCLKRIEINYLDDFTDFINKIRGKWNFIGYFQTIKNSL